MTSKETKTDFIGSPEDESQQEPTISESTPSSYTATTTDSPNFGWSAYAERVNGRFAMIGFSAILLIEAIYHDTFLHWAGFSN